MSSFIPKAIAVEIVIFIVEVMLAAVIIFAAFVMLAVVINVWMCMINDTSCVIHFGLV